MKPTCQPFVEQLCDGTAPAGDAALAEHLGTCLDCFRLQAELRDLPRIATALRAEAPADPGEAFWNAFPAQVVTAARAGIRADAGARRPVEAPSLLERFTAWFQRPLPAALAGAVCTAAVIVALRMPSGARRPRPAPSASPAASVVAEGAAARAEPGVPDGELTLAPTDVGELDDSALRAVLDSLESDDDEADGFARAIAQGAGDLSPVQEIETLDGETLRALAKDLEKQAL